MTTAQPSSMPIAAVGPRILTALSESPGQGAYELAAALGCDPKKVTDLLRRMLSGGAVVADELNAQPRAGRPARIFFVAPEGTPPRPQDPAKAEQSQRPAQIAQQQRRRTRKPGPYRAQPLPAWRAGTEPACRDAGPGLFFGPELESPAARGQRVAAAKAVCVGCPVRRACLDAARERGERWGIWGGADLETERRQRSPQTTRPGVSTPGRA